MTVAGLALLSLVELSLWLCSYYTAFGYAYQSYRVLGTQFVTWSGDIVTANGTFLAIWERRDTPLSLMGDGEFPPAGHEAKFNIGTWTPPQLRFLAEFRLELGDPGNRLGRVAIQLPYWFCILLTSAIPLNWLRFVRRRRQWARRSRAGLCPNCGYDRQGGGPVCPECGERGSPRPLPATSGS